MDKNNLDRLFKNKLQDRKFDVDRKQWMAMENIISQGNVATPKQSKKRYVLLFSIVLLSAISILTGIYLFNGISEDNTILSETPIAKIKLKEKTTRVLDIVSTPENLEEKVKESLESKTEPSLVLSENNLQGEKVSNIGNQLFDKLSQRSLEKSSRESKIYTTNTAKEEDLNIRLSAFSDPSDLKVIENNDVKIGSSAFAETKSQQSLNHTYIQPLVSVEHVTNLLPIAQKYFSPNYAREGMIKVINNTIKQRGVYAQYKSIQNGNTISAGVYYGVKIYNNWSLVVAPAYEYAQVNSFILAEQSDNVFGFSVQDYNQQILANKIHRISIPVSLHYNHNNHLVGAGVVFQRPIAVGAEKTIYIGEQVAEEKKIWVDTDLYDRSDFNGRFSYEYFIAPRLGLGVNYDFPLTKQASFNNQSSIGLQLKMNI
jgi:hypothetical protein